MASPKRLDKKRRILNKGESQLPDGRYMYRYTDMYGERKKIYSWKLEETDATPAGKRVKKALRELIKEIEADKLNDIDTFTSKNTTLNARWALYFKELVISETTAENYKYLWEKHIRETIGKMKIADITTSIVYSLYSDLYIEKCYSISTIKSIHTIVNPVFEDCIGDNLMTVNPATRAMKKIKNLEDRKAKERKVEALDELEGEDVIENEGERVILTEKQERAFVEFLYTDKRCKNWKNLFTVLLKTGARISEVCGIIDRDIDLNVGSVYIRRQLLYRKKEGKCQRFVAPTKTGPSKRKFPIYCDELKNALVDEMNKHSDKGQAVNGFDGWVFRNRYNNPLSENNANDALRRIIAYYNKTVEDKELKIRDFSCHNFRHTFATKCLMKNLSERGTKGLIGHSPNKNNVTDRYVHPPFEYLQQEAAKLND